MNGDIILRVITGIFLILALIVYLLKGSGGYFQTIIFILLILVVVHSLKYGKKKDKDDL